jgi:membrane fusion protein
MKNLYRKQVISELSNKHFGDVVLNQPPILVWGTLIFILSTISLILVLNFGSYARKETVHGYLVPDKGLIKVYASQKGVLIRKHFIESQQVSKNDLLFTISTIQSNTQGSDRDAQLIQELEQQKSILSSTYQQHIMLGKEKINNIDKKIIRVKKELLQLQKLISIQEKQLKLASTRTSKLTILYDKGHLSTSQLSEIEQTNIVYELQLQSTYKEKIQLDNKIAELLDLQKELPLEWQSRLDDIKNNNSDITQRILEISSRRIYSIHAPVSGSVTNVQITEGQTINAQIPLLAILPVGTKFQADLFLPTRAIGFIDNRQSVLLRYAAFPHQRYGLQKGHINKVSQAILTPSELSVPVSLNEPVYKVSVALDKQTVSAYGKELKLQAGMILDADIIIDKRSLIQWLLAPVYSLLGQ